MTGLYVPFFKMKSGTCTHKPYKWMGRKDGRIESRGGEGDDGGGGVVWWKGRRGVVAKGEA